MMLALLLLFCVSPVKAFHRSFHGESVLRITPRTNAQLAVVHSLKNMWKSAYPNDYSQHLDFWTEASYLDRPVDVKVTIQGIAALKALLNTNNITYSVMIADVQQAVAENLRGVSTATSAADFDFTKYNTNDAINAWMATLPTQFPGLAFIEQVATSYEKRPITVVKLQGKKSNAVKPGFWFDGGIHAREWIAPAAVVWMLNQLLTQYGKDATITKLVDEIDIFVLPVFNPDGYQYTFDENRMWRKTRSHTGHVCIGVDPNRNWAYKWNDGGSSTDPCDDAYEGPKAFSEIEVSTVAGYICNHTNINGYINFHSYSQLWMSPWGWSADLPKDYTNQEGLSKAAVAALKKVHGTDYQYGPIYTTIYPASGSSADYTYGVCNVVYSYGVELRDTGEYGFLLPADQIVPTGEETLAGVLAGMQYMLDHPRL